jgi:hypothetical protein
MHRRTTLRLVLLSSLVTAAIAASTAAADDARSIQQGLDRTPQVGEKPFAPADGSVVKLTPPAFVWLPLVKRPAKYVLAVSQSADFPAGTVTQTFEAPISVHIPAHVLSAGKYYWRVGVAGRDAKVIWGKTRSFNVAADAIAWPFPDMDRLLAKIPQQHPRLFFPGESLAKARVEWPKLAPREYQSLLHAAEADLGKPLYAEPDYVPQGPRHGEVYAQIIRSSRPPMDAMERCALAYVLSGDRRFGEETKRLLLHFFAWNPEGSTNLFHNDEPAMWVMQRGTRAYDWTYALFTPEERAKIEPVLKARTQQFVKRLTSMPFESKPYLSHPARDVGFLGESAISFAHEWPEARGWLEYSLKIYWSIYPAWADEDGGWQEGPSYWSAYQNLALHFATALRQATGEEITRKPFFHNTPYYKLYTNPPYAQMSPFGDNQHIRSDRGAGNLMYDFATLLRDPYLRWYPAMQRTGAGTGPMGVVLADPSLTAKPPVDLPQARCFPGTGLVAMHDDLCDPARSAYLVLRSSPMGSVSHGHADQNAFAIEACGEPLAVASGYYPWYSSPHHEQWTRQTKAVNSITIDGGQGQVSRSSEARGKIESFTTDGAFDQAVADATPAYGGKLTRFVRHVIHVRSSNGEPGAFVIVDELEAPRPVRFEWNLHALEKMDIRDGQREVLIQRGQARLLASFLAPQDLVFSQTDQFSVPPEDKSANQWHLVAATKDKVRKSLFIVVLRPYRQLKGAKPAVAPAITVSDGGRRLVWNSAGYSQAELTIQDASRQPKATESALAICGISQRAADAAEPPRLRVSVDGHAYDVAGRKTPRPGLLWEDRFNGADGRYRVRLPAGVKLLMGVQAVHDGEAVALHHGEQLWWYGAAAAPAAKLDRIAAKAKTAPR